MSVKSPLPTVGILFPGEMGAALARLLVDQKVDVVTTLEGRSEDTRRHAEDAGLRVVSSLAELTEAAQIVVSVVPPAAALEVAEQYSRVAHHLPASPVYVDANSISPRTARQVGEVVCSAGVEFVDAAIHGLASRLGEQGTLYLSGAAAERVAELFESRLRVERLGDEPGMASMTKMLMGGVSKGLVSLFIEMGLVAHQSGLVDEFLSGCQRYYPGIMTAVERMLPSYPRHARRRADEMTELVGTMRDLNLQPSLVLGVERLLRSLGNSDLEERGKSWFSAQSEAPTIPDLIDLISQENPLRPRQTLAASAIDETT